MLRFMATLIRFMGSLGGAACAGDMPACQQHRRMSLECLTPINFRALHACVFGMRSGVASQQLSASSESNGINFICGYHPAASSKHAEEQQQIGERTASRQLSASSEQLSASGSRSAATSQPAAINQQQTARGSEQLFGKCERPLPAR